MRNRAIERGLGILAMLSEQLDSLDRLAYIHWYPVFHAGEVHMPKGMPGQRKVGFTFPAELVERLDEAKWELRKTKAEIVIEAVEEYLDRHGIKEIKAPPRERPRTRRQVSA
jgi:hypothetical protein